MPGNEGHQVTPSLLPAPASVLGIQVQSGVCGKGARTCWTVQSDARYCEGLNASAADISTKEFNQTGKDGIGWKPYLDTYCWICPAVSSLPGEGGGHSLTVSSAGHQNHLHVAVPCKSGTLTQA